MVSVDEGWAVGGRYINLTAPPYQEDGGGFILHYQGGHWTPVSSPTQQVLWAIAMVSPTDGWAVGDHGVILHYTGSQWAVTVPPESLPNGANLRSISMVSASEGWAVGSGRVPGAPNSVAIFVHDVRGHWTEIDPNTLPIGASNLQAVSLVSANAGLAVGGSSLAYYQQGQWREDYSEESDPKWQRAEWLSVSMVSATEGWAAGYNLSPTYGVIAHYCGGKWNIVPAFAALQLFGMTMISPSEGWAVGIGGGQPVILHYVNSQWTPVAAPAPKGRCILHGISMPAANEGWAVGECDSNDSPLLLHYQAGNWSLYQG